MKTKKLKLERNGDLQPVEIVPPTLLKLDLGAGIRTREGFEGVDMTAYPGIKHIVDLRGAWPWVDSSVEEAHCAHFLEHLTNYDEKYERVHFFNELYRVMAPGAKCQLIIPHWCSMRYYGDPTHKEPFSEFGFYYLLREWRMGNPEKGIIPNAPHSDSTNVSWGYSCDFDAQWGYNVHPMISLKNQEAQQYAFQFFKEAIQDLYCTLTCRK